MSITLTCGSLLAHVSTSYDKNNIGDNVGEVDEGAGGIGSGGVDGNDGDGENGVDPPKGTGGRSRSRVLSFDMTMDKALQSLASFASGRGGGDGGRARGGDNDRDKRTGDETDGGVGVGEGEGYASEFRLALSLWRDHAGDVWYARGEFYGLPPPRRGAATTTTIRRTSKIPLIVVCSILGRRWRAWRPCCTASAA